MVVQIELRAFVYGQSSYKPYMGAFTSTTSGNTIFGGVSEKLHPERMTSRPKRDRRKLNSLQSKRLGLAF